MSALMRLIEAHRARREAGRETPSPVHDRVLRPADFRDIALMPDEQVARMELMAGVFGANIDEMRRGPEGLKAARACARCDADDHCRDVLLHGATPATCGFCPNAARYAAEAERQTPPD